MNRKIRVKRDKLWGQKKVYIVLLIILAVGTLLGFLFPFILSNDSHELLKTSISSFFNNVMNQDIDYHTGIYQSLFANFSFLISVWLLGISVIGLPIVLFLLLYKGFIFGFSISSIIFIYGIKGVPSAFSYVFPGMILLLITTLLLSFYSVAFSIKLFRYLFLKENLNFKMIMNRYLKILLICSFSFLIVSLLDVYVAPIFMNVFTFLLK